MGTVTRLPIGPKEGTMLWLRAWHGPQFKRGAMVEVDGERCWITSAAPDGRVRVCSWTTGRVVAVLPHEVSF